MKVQNYIIPANHMGMGSFIIKSIFRGSVLFFLAYMGFLCFSINSYQCYGDPTLLYLSLFLAFCFFELWREANTVDTDKAKNTNS